MTELVVDEVLAGTRRRPRPRRPAAPRPAQRVQDHVGAVAAGHLAVGAQRRAQRVGRVRGWPTRMPDVGVGVGALQGPAARPRSRSAGRPARASTTLPRPGASSGTPPSTSTLYRTSAALSPDLRALPGRDREAARPRAAGTSTRLRLGRAPARRLGRARGAAWPRRGLDGHRRQASASASPAAAPVAGAPGPVTARPAARDAAARAAGPPRDRPRRLERRPAPAAAPSGSRRRLVRHQQPRAPQQQHDPGRDDRAEPGAAGAARGHGGPGAPAPSGSGAPGAPAPSSAPRRAYDGRGRPATGTRGEVHAAPGAQRDRRHTSGRGAGRRDACGRAAAPPAP